MSIEENKDLVRRYFDAIDAERDASVIDRFAAPDFKDHSPTPGFPADREGLKASFEYFLSATPDGTHELHDLVAEGDTVVARVSGRGTHKGELLGVEPTDREVGTGGIAIFRVREGLITEHWNEIDVAGLLAQLHARLTDGGAQ
jgi:predicted ester cyclase